MPLAPASTGETLVRLPSVAPLGGGFVVVGTRMPPLSVPGTVMSYDTSLPAFIGFRVSTAGGVAALPPLPALATGFLPRAGLAPDGGFHMVWFEPDSGDRTRYPPDPTSVGALREIRFDGKRWSQPRDIVSAHRIGWDDVSGSPLVAFSGDLRVAEGMSASVTSGEVLFIAGLMGDSIRRQRIPLRGSTYPRSVALAATADGEAVVAMLTPGIAERGTIPQVVRSSDGGRRWAAPSSLPDDPPRHASGIRLVMTPDATLHAVWVIGSDDAEHARGLRHVASRDGGRTWSAAADFDAGEHVYEPKVAVDRCGVIHVVYSSFGKVGRARLGHLLIENGGWRRASSAPFGNPSLDPALAQLADSTLVLVWSRPDTATQRMLDDLHVTSFRPEIAPRLPRTPRFETVYSILAPPRPDRPTSPRR